jgi:hypothetical protein
MAHAWSYCRVSLVFERSFSIELEHGMSVHEKYNIRPKLCSWAQIMSLS